MLLHPHASRSYITHQVCRMCARASEKSHGSNITSCGILSIIVRHYFRDIDPATTYLQLVQSHEQNLIFQPNSTWEVSEVKDITTYTSTSQANLPTTNQPTFINFKKCEEKVDEHDWNSFSLIFFKSTTKIRPTKCIVEHFRAWFCGLSYDILLCTVLCREFIWVLKVHASPDYVT